MPLNDKSFHTLILSLVLHGILVIFMRMNATPAWLPPHNETTEITLIEQEAKKPKSIVTEVNQKDLLQKFKDQADFLSQFTQRVKEQLKARKSGETRNAAGASSSKAAQAERAAGMSENRDRGETRHRTNNNSFTKNIVMGESTVSERIPGVKEGAFTSLNTDQFTYYTFFARINEQVRYRWIRQIRQYLDSLTQKDFSELSKRERITRVEIILEPNGVISNAVVHFTSGYKALDQAAAQAFMNAAPFMNPPQGMVEEDGKIHLYYEFYVTLSPTAFVGP